MASAGDNIPSQCPGSTYSREALAAEAGPLLAAVKDCHRLDEARKNLQAGVREIFERNVSDGDSAFSHKLVRARDCARAFATILQGRSDGRAGFSVAQALWDIAAGRERGDLKPAFFAEMIHLVRGLGGEATGESDADTTSVGGLEGRAAAKVRSNELDRIWQTLEARMNRYPHGLSDEAQQRRQKRKQHVLQALGADEEQWNDWNWQVRNVITDAATLQRLVSLDEDQLRAITLARRERLPFGITPYYVSLMDDDGANDMSIRSQVIPPMDYVEHMAGSRDGLSRSCDFMRESDTSPIDLVTRRYPGIVILKPFNTCPQICVYCQRNWEIEQAMAPDALADEDKIAAAIDWIARHPAIREVLVTGGDPLGMTDEQLGRILTALAKLPNVDMIRIGTRTPVTLPMRITDGLADLLGSFRELGRRDVAVVTHVQHPYEITMDTAAAVDRLKRAGISVYNQQAYTFYVSRRFESAALRMLLRRIGIDPYYTFAPKGKAETASYRVPLARILQERKEEARLIPGLRRADEPVYNLPGLGKNYLRAAQHRDLLSILPDGSRVYEFHPWEKNIVQCDSVLAQDVPILDYLRRLGEIGEDPKDYQSIWCYF